jgi:hypothetical protein
MGSEGEISLCLDGVIRMHGSEEESETWMKVYLVVAITLGKTLPGGLKRGSRPLMVALEKVTGN